MAVAMSGRAVGERMSLWRLPLNLVRSFSSSSTTSPAPPNPDSSATVQQKPKRRKKKNLFEVLQFLPNWGVGYHVAKSHWTNVYYEITKINLYKDGRHGKAWGTAFKDGVPTAAPKKMSGVHKRCWRYIRDAKKEQPVEKIANVEVA